MKKLAARDFRDGVLVWVGPYTVRATINSRCGSEITTEDGRVFGLESSGRVFVRAYVGTEPDTTTPEADAPGVSSR